MKKLLSILASVAVAGSSATAVVACSTNPTTNNQGQPGGDITGGPSVINHDGSNSGQSGIDPSNTAPSNGGTTNSGNDNSDINNGQSSNTNPKFVQASKFDISKVKTQAQWYSQKKILEDQYGVSGDYIDSMNIWDQNTAKSIFNPETKKDTSTGMSDTGANDPAKNPLVDFLYKSGFIDEKMYNTLQEVLGLVAGIDVPNPAEIGAMASGISKLLPMLQGTIKSALGDTSAVKAKVDKIFTPTLKNIFESLTKTDNKLDSKYDSLSVGDSMKAAMVGIAYIIAKGTNDNENAKLFANPEKINAKDAKGVTTYQNAINYLFPRIGDLINTARVKDVASVDMTNGQIYVDGSGWDTVPDLTKDYKWTLEYQDANGNLSNNLGVTSLSTNDVKDDSGNVTSTQLVIKTAPVVMSKDGTYVLKYKPAFNSKENNSLEFSFNISKGNYTQSYTDTDGKTKYNYEVTSGSALEVNISSLANDNDVKVATDVIKLLSMYIHAFNPLKTDNIKDANHIFADPSVKGRNLENYDAVSTVRKASIASQNFNFNIFEFIKEISYYLGYLDQAQGKYRLQQLLAMFFLDTDKGSGDLANKQFLLNWNDSAPDKDPNWDDRLDLVNDNLTPMAELVQDFLKWFLPNNEPQGMKGTLDSILGAFNIGWADISTMITHNVYILMQSLVWGRGFKFSNQLVTSPLGIDIHLDVLDKGMDIPKGILYDSDPLDPLGIARKTITFPGLQKINEWNKLEKNGLMDFLFNGDVFGIFNELLTQKDMKKFLANMDGAKLLAGKRILSDGQLEGYINQVTQMIAPYGVQTINGATITLNKKLNEAAGNKINFVMDGKQSTLNTELKSNESTSTSDYDKAGLGKPMIQSVTDTGLNESGEHLLVIKTKNIWDTSDGATYYDEDHTSNKVDGMGSSDWKSFLKTLLVDGSNKNIDLDNSSAVDENKTTESSWNTSASVANATYKLAVKGDISENTKISGDTFEYVEKSWGYYYGKKVHIGNTKVNVFWADGSDPLDLRDKLDVDFTSTDWLDDITMRFKDSVDSTEFADLKITDGNNKQFGRMAFTYAPKLNLSHVASETLSWLFGILGLPNSSKTNSPFGLPVADSYSLGGLILEIGKLVDNGKLNDLQSYIDPQKFSKLVGLVFGTGSNDNIVDKLLDAINGNNITGDLNKVLGLTSDTGIYAKDGLIGALIMAFTDVDPMNDLGDKVRGDTEAKTPLWTYLINLVSKAWNFVDSRDESKVLRDLNADNLYNFDWTNAKTSEDGNQMVVKITYHYDGWWTYSKDGTNRSKPKDGSYTLTINNVKDDSQVYKISKN